MPNYANDQFKLHNISYILTPNKGREYCNTILESLKHDDMTLLYKKCQKNGYEQTTVHLRCLFQTG